MLCPTLLYFLSFSRRESPVFIAEMARIQMWYLPIYWDYLELIAFLVRCHPRNIYLQKFSGSARVTAYQVQSANFFRQNFRSGLSSKVFSLEMITLCCKSFAGYTFYATTTYV